jgi:hypothetical protein
VVKHGWMRVSRLDACLHDAHTSIALPQGEGQGQGEVRVRVKAACLHDGHPGLALPCSEDRRVSATGGSSSSGTKDGGEFVERDTTFPSLVMVMKQGRGMRKEVPTASVAGVRARG